MQRNAITIVTCIVFGGIVTICVLRSNTNPPITYQQNFHRIIIPGIITQTGFMDVKKNSYYIAGLTNNHVYLGNKHEKLALLIVNNSLTKTEHLYLKIHGVNIADVEHPFLQIDSPFFYIKDGNMPGIFKGILSKKIANQIVKQTPFFNQAVPIDANSVAIQATLSLDEDKTKRNVLGKVSTKEPYIKFKHDLLLNQKVDNFFSTKGALRYNKELNCLIYTYNYRNEYLVMDTALNLIYKGNTLDTVTQAKIKPIEIDENVYTLANPSAVVNINAQVFGNYLFIHSNLMAQNEQREKFDNSSVVDIYDVPTRQYKASFYIPNHLGSRMINFKVLNHIVVVIYDQYLACFHLSLDNISPQKFSD